MNFTKSSSTKQIRNETPMSKANNKLMQAIKYIRSHLRSPLLAPFASAWLRSHLCSYLRSHHDHHPQLPPPSTTAAASSSSDLHCSFLRTFLHSYKQFWVFGALTAPALPNNSKAYKKTNSKFYLIVTFFFTKAFM